MFPIAMVLVYNINIRFVFIADYCIDYMLHIHNSVYFVSRLQGNILDYWGELTYPNTYYRFILSFSLTGSGFVAANFLLTREMLDRALHDVVFIVISPTVYRGRGGQGGDVLAMSGRFPIFWMYRIGYQIFGNPLTTLGGNSFKFADIYMLSI